MKTYYEDASVKIYHADCREILPHLENQFDAVIADPPYNCGKDYGTHNDSMSPEEYESWSKEIVDLCLKVAPNQFWVAPKYKLNLWSSLLPKAHLIVIHSAAAFALRQGWIDKFAIALAIGNPKPQAPDFWGGITLRGAGYFFREETFDHPGYTPIAIMAKATTLLSTNCVCDPFAGTGTTLRAAKDLGRKAIGIEIEERYCEIAAKRMAQEILNLKTNE